jgi:multidrug efflux pump
MFRLIVRSGAPIFLVAVAIFVFGLLAYIALPRESAPDVKVPFVMVTTPYQGVSPRDIESLVSIPLENELAGLKSLKLMRSTSAEGVSILFLEFEPDVVIEDALQRVRDRVNRARPKLPDDVDESSVRELSFTDIPVLLVTVAGPYDETILKKIVEDLEDEVARVPGVLEAELAGGTEREFQVLLDPARLDHFGASVGDVVGALQQENVNVPGGDVRVGDANLLVRVPAEIKTAEDIEQTPVRLEGGYPVRVSDLGRVRDGLAERSTYARMNGQPAVSLRVKKRTGANIVGVADEVKAIVARRAEAWPDGVTYRILADQSEAIRSMVNELQNNIFTALILVVGVIVFFMGFRNSLLVALSIPLSMFASFAVLQALGFTLNMVVLFSLILALGMLVDNAIVVVENVYRHLELGKGRWRAAIDGTREVALPVAASTATTIAAFFPMVFWGGIMGQFMGYLPKTVIIVLTASLVVGVFILPVFASRVMKRRVTAADAPEDETPEQALARMEAQEAAAFQNPGRVMGWYKAILTASIRWRYASLGLGVVALLLTFVAYGFLNHGFEFFPMTEPDRAIIDVRGPDGTDLDTTDRIVRRVEALVATVPDVDVFVSEVGVSSGNGGGLVGSSSSPQSARITVDFLPHPAAAKPGETPRAQSSDVAMLRLRELMSGLTGAEISVEAEEMGPPVGADVEVKVRGDDYRAVGEAAQRLRREIARLDGVADLRDDYRVNRPELALRIDRAAAKQAGVSTGLVGNTVRTAVNGATATTVRDGEEEYDVVVKLAPEFTDDVQSVLGLRLPGRMERDPNLYPVPLSAVASYDLAGGTGSVARIDQALTVTITGDVVEGVSVDEKQREVRALLDAFEVPPGVTAELGGSSTEQAEAAAFLGWAMMVAVALIALVLVAQFNDFVQPVIILITVVLSLIGVLWGLILTATPFGIIMTGIGVISLAGVVVNNAIVLLDYVGQLQREGHDVEESLVRAGMTRFRPVMLTATTTVLGLVPMALGISIELGAWWVGGVVPVPTLAVVVGSQSSAFWGPMAIAVIFGLTFATVLTLVMVPTMYSIYEDLRRMWRPSRKAAALAAKVAIGVLALGALGVPEAAQAVSLEEAWAAARQNNPDLQSVEESTFQARNQRIQAWALVQPRISAQGNYAYFSYGDVKLDFSEFLEGLPIPIEAPEPTVVQRGSNFDGNLSVSQPLFNGMALPLLAGAYKNADAAALDARRTDQQIRAGVARAYLGLASAREAVGLGEKSLSIAKSQLELARRQVEAGVATPRAVLQGQLGVAQAERDLRRAREQVVAAAESFTSLTGLPGDVPLDAVAELAVPSSLDEALDRAAGARPDLRATALREDVAGLQVRAETLAWLPEVSARWTGIANQTPGFAGRTTYWTAGVNATWTLWDGGMRLATIRQAASQQRQSRFQAEKVQRSVEEEVRVAFEAHARARVAVKAVEDEVALATDSLDLARRGFEAGTATFLEVEQAELGLRSAELNRLTERTSLSLAAVDLLLAIGEL